MFTSETVLFTFRNEHVYFRNRLGSIFMAVAQVALAQPEKSHVERMQNNRILLQICVKLMEYYTNTNRHWY